MTRVLVNFIQDRSGSMQSVWAETLSGFKVFVNELREKGPKEGVDYLFSLTTFDTLVETPIVAAPIANVDAGILAKHGPRGGTALYDAVGATIQNTDANRCGAEKVIVVVVTDGQENSSREWTKELLHAAVDSKLKQGDWTFTYLGTQPETWDDAGALGIAPGATSVFRGRSSAMMYAAVAGSVGRLSASQQKSSPALMAEFLDDEVAAAAEMQKAPPPPAKEKKPEPVVDAKPEKKRSWK